jgi:hypothetical protein
MQPAACVVVAFMAAVCLSRAARAEDGTAFHLPTMHRHPWFWDVMVIPAFGWLVGSVKGQIGSRKWLEHYWHEPSPWVIFLLDVLVFIGGGAYIGTDIYNPTTFLSAVAAGLSWPIALASLAKRD